MSMIRHAIVICGALLASLATGTAPARAQLLPSCTLSITAVAFGSVDVTLNAVADTTGTLSVTCTGLLVLFPIRVCANLGPGSGGGTNAANRTMLSGANTLGYGLFTDAARSIPWGSSTWGAGGGTVVEFTVAAPSTVNRTIFGRIPAGQQTVVPGSYQSAFAGADAFIRWGLLSAFTGCNLLTTSTSASFLVTATVPKTCRVNASDMNFASVTILTANIDAASALSTTCTMGTPYWVQLNGGLSAAIDPTQRRMTKLTESVLYGLYRDAARALPWGQTQNVNTQSGTGTGLLQNLPVYGRVAPQTTPSPGPYQDTVVVTMNY